MVTLFKTFQLEFLKNLKYWSKLTGIQSEHQLLVYGGKLKQVRNVIRVEGWKVFLANQAGST